MISNENDIFQEYHSYLNYPFNGGRYILNQNFDSNDEKILNCIDDLMSMLGYLKRSYTYADDGVSIFAYYYCRDEYKQY